MNGNRSIVYREFVGVIPVAKTLRNELRPVGHTQEHICLLYTSDAADEL